MASKTERVTPRTKAGLVSILDEDEALGAALSPEEFQAARHYVVAPLVVLEPGSHAPERTFIGRDLTGVLVLEGLLIRQVVVAGRQSGELVAPGSLLRPWDHFGVHAPLPFEVRWRVLQTARLAVLDAHVLGVAGRWPALLEALIERGINRAQTAGFSVAVHALHHVELRLVVLFWQLADRFGKVTRDGIVVPLALTHRDLAELVGAQRPSVSTAISELARQGSIVRRADRTWLLRGDPPQELRDLRAPAGRRRARH